MGRKAKLWSYSTGVHGCRVRVAERVPGGSLYAMTTAPGGRGWRKVSLGHKDKERAMEEAHKLAVKRQKGDEPLERLTVAGMFELFSRSVLPRQCAHHLEELKRAIDLWTRFLGGSRIVETIGPSDWEAFERARAPGEIDGRGRLVPDPEKRKPVGQRTIQKEMKVLRAACRRATIERTRTGGFLLGADPTRGLPLPVEKNPKRPTANSERYEKLLAVADQVKARHGKGKSAHMGSSYLPLLIPLAGESGRRIGAILALRWSDWLSNEGKHGALRWRAPSDKVRKDWIIPVSANLSAALKTAQAKRGGIGELLMFPALNDPTKPVDYRVIARWLQKAEELAGLPHLEGGAYHSFRRMWACQRKHHPARDTATAGGWKDTATLQRVYEAADVETLEAVVNGARRLRGIIR